MELLVQPLDQALPFESGANLLQALRDHNVPVSYSCMAGRCGTCRCKVIAGQVLESGREMKLTGLNDGHYVLACMSVLTESCTIEIPEPDEVVTHPAKILKAKVVAIEDLAHDIKGIRLKASKPLEFSPGQYATLQFTPEHIRPYSMAGLADDDTLEFHVRVVPDGRVSGYVANQLKVGDAVRVSGPLGTAYLRVKHQGPILCVAGGTGLAPVLSIVRGALARGMRNPIHVYFGARSPVDVYKAEVLEQLARQHDNLTVHIVLSAGGEAGPAWRQGLVTEAVEQDWPRLDGFRAYVCGAPPMVEAATLMFTRKGLGIEHIYADAFYASGD
ncbi:2Fe-2S iron-sulfur cluster-binding protein [Pusillimonas noertemannii]|uniref:Ferredoxin-NAD(P)+ reductase (Naphthalene dioxygenase ferredoxin-specific) n=1 Tax=Pusillimonas noertemannii TaxID=305977 RepID=A0A2U1CPX6_9BURK|nr:2Fe-2S iron-sulfur cluster-binding protein [Pusillimonas noertemannii]NYT67277.1 2Fe-2S iron-sulfur cluster binding domain-containing protein [Pusillimonas noertemannii]PVY67950.1 ferredoxin-NAD(P)+ reductase (naphthalene dioxygenase ferredoxin-specific) [Pusillimonas noertemannii]TFL12530.1 2Fe-2S iron-sulfur cluster binding domain-containing protein [Pusillimonas noertemannii]